MSENRMATLLPAALADQTKTATLELVNVWKSHFIELEPSVRERMSMMGPAKSAVAKDAAEIVSNSPQLMPAYRDAEGFRVDLANAATLRPLIGHLKDLVRELETLLLVSEAEAYDTALAVYAHVREMAERGGSATAQAAAETLGAHFANRRPRKNSAQA